METTLIIIARTVFLYVLILFIFRLMGKREIGELSILDLVVFVMIAELAVVGIEDLKDPLHHTVIPMLVLLVIQITFAFLSLKNARIRRLIDGKPTIIINNGKIDERAMLLQRYNFDDLLMQLREKDVKNIQDVEYAILEPSGRLSVLKKEKKKSTEMIFPFILDGKIQHDHLQKIGKNEVWLRKELEDRGYHHLEYISFCSFMDGTFYIDIKDRK
ncbi:DUF421 domain-containing protein [Aeribacillus alveayuensis]|uniref:Uncharacterized membrane protein YcaP (DUF421 family) n=1 Tax=Aeribacillus alveayuensis TaxID=279215 RepID=A0ABT9VJT4_9BACI|nr:uncharacterized membrane protein YcaP (DUF421 family) [Bacillus alveayuensis]